MKRHRILRHLACSSSRVLVLAAGLDLGVVATARAADPPPAPPPPAAAAPAPAAPAPPAAAAPPAPAPPAAMPPPPAPPAAAAPVPAPPPPEPPPPAPAEKPPAIDVGAWIRAAGRLQSTSNPQNLDGAKMDTAYAELHVKGDVMKYVGVVLNLNASGVNPGGGGTVGLEDAIVAFNLADPVHVWVGQLLVPVDRPNFAGPFFSLPWNYPGFITVGANTVVTAPHEGASAGRNIGGSFWGNDADGKVKYAAGVFLPPGVGTNPLLSARVSTAIIGSEKGYFGNESFYGDQDIVALGIGGQYQKDGSVGAPAGAGAAPTDTYAEFNADALAEFKYGGDGGGWWTLEGDYNHFSGQYNAVKDAFFITAAIATPKVGPGNIQPMVRYQQGSGDGIPNASALDAAVNYILKGPAMRLVVNFQHADIGNGAQANMVQFGAAAIFF